MNKEGWDQIRLAAFLCNFPLYDLDNWESYWTKDPAQYKYWMDQASYLMKQRKKYAEEHPEPRRR